MGYDINRIEGEVRDLLRCNICLDVLKEAVYIRKCEHLFCLDCIDTWFQTSSYDCPTCRCRATATNLKDAPRLVRNLLDELQIRCSFQEYGCRHREKLVDVERHEAVCEFRPERLVPCPGGCGFTVRRKDLADHQCLNSLRLVFASHRAKLEALEERVRVVGEESRKQTVPELIEEESAKKAKLEDGDGDGTDGRFWNIFFKNQ